ncbi:penicillin-binding protein 2, partial [Enterococcus faecalis]|nr:penicillin-binding protein 2 [Enterococcus faecalis]
MTFFNNKIIKYFLRAGNNPDFLTIFCYNENAKLFSEGTRGMKKNSFIDKIKKTDAAAKSQRGRKPHIPFRLNLLFFVIFTLFVSLIV